MRTASYDKFPVVEIPDASEQAWRGWPEICCELFSAMDTTGTPVLAIECYPGVFEKEIGEAVRAGRPGVELINMHDALLPEEEIAQLIAPFNGGDDPIFGFASNLTLRSFFDPDRLKEFHEQASSASLPLVFLGPGAFLIAARHALHVYADLPRWEIQQRQRCGQIANLGSSDTSLKPSLKYKRAFFVDWRAADGMKRATMARWDYVLDTTATNDPRLVKGDALRAALSHCATRPIRMVPFFDPGPWGGQWMKEVCDLDRTEPTSPGASTACRRRIASGSVSVPSKSKFPAIDLVFAQPEALLGEPVVSPLRRRISHPLRLPRYHGRRQPVASGPAPHRVTFRSTSACTTPRTKAITARCRARRACIWGESRHRPPRDGAAIAARPTRGRPLSRRRIT